MVQHIKHQTQGIKISLRGISATLSKCSLRRKLDNSDYVKLLKSIPEHCSEIFIKQLQRGADEDKIFTVHHRIGYFHYYVIASCLCHANCGNSNGKEQLSIL